MPDVFPKIAMVDVDGTLISVSSEKQFLVHMMKKGLLKPLHAVAFGLQYLIHPLMTLRLGKGWNRSYLKYIPPDVLIREATLFSEEYLRNTLRPEIVELLRSLSGNGCRIMLVSASLSYLIEPLAGVLPVDGISASVPEVSEKKFTGGLTCIRPWGRSKVIVARNLCSQAGIDPRECLAVGDSWSDRFVMDFCGKALVIHPCRKLAVLAGSRGWGIVEGKHTHWA